MIVDSLGRIVVGGEAKEAIPGSLIYDHYAAVWRFDSTGTLDAKFGVNGYAKSSSSTIQTDGIRRNGVRSITIDAKNRILASGIWWGKVDPEMGLWRFDDFGQIDTIFGTGGSTYYPNATGTGILGESGNKVVIDSATNNIYVAGNFVPVAASNHEDSAIWRYTDSGALDTTFGTNGVVVKSFDPYISGSEGFHDFVIQNDKLVTTGFSDSDGMIVAQYFLDGSDDTNFGNGGNLSQGFSNSGSPNAIGNKIMFDDIGKIYVIGSYLSDMAVWRLRY